MCQLGLKVWSTNDFYIKPAKELYSEQVFDYVELYVVPGTHKTFIQQWSETKLPVFLHAPHSQEGFNFSLKECEKSNRSLIKEVDGFREILDPEKVIFHPGTNGSLDETIRQIKVFQKEFSALFEIAVLENKPKLGVSGEDCIGSSPEEIKRVLDETGLGFCLDMGHAICYAAWKKEEYQSVIDQFIRLNPRMYHLSDGKVSSKTDKHLNFGVGDFDLKGLVAKIPHDAQISIETDKRSKSDLDDFKKDAFYLRQCIQTN